MNVDKSEIRMERRVMGVSIIYGEHAATSEILEEPNLTVMRGGGCNGSGT